MRSEPEQEESATCFMSLASWSTELMRSFSFAAPRTPRQLPGPTAEHLPSRIIASHPRIIASHLLES
eukprot:175489-Rhodomonas_salina.1